MFPLMRNSAEDCSGWRTLGKSYSILLKLHHMLKYKEELFRCQVSIFSEVEFLLLPSPVGLKRMIVREDAHRGRMESHAASWRA